MFFSDRRHSFIINHHKIVLVVFRVSNICVFLLSQSFIIIHVSLKITDKPLLNKKFIVHLLLSVPLFDRLFKISQYLMKLWWLTFRNYPVYWLLLA